MVLSLAKFREKIQNSIYNAIGSNATLQNVSSSSMDDDGYGDVTYTYGTGTAITLVPFNQLEAESFQSFGDLLAGELNMIIPYDETVSNTTKITYEGDTYIVKELEKYPYQGGSLAYAVRLAKKQF